MPQTHFDVIIIGSGAGGGTLAHKLATAGKKVLLLERGGYVPREKDNWSSRAVFVEGKYNAPEAWLESQGQEFHPGTHYYVGGNTKFYGAALLRKRESDFNEVRHHGGIAPAWPISYQDLQPYYLQAEALYQVHGNRGEDPTEPPEASPYPFPGISHEPRIQRLHNDLERLGLKPFHVPVGVMLNETDPQASKCIRCNTCDGFPCLIHAKSDAEVVCIQPGLATGNLTLITNAKVNRLITDSSGKAVTAVEATVGPSVGSPENAQINQFTGDIVVVSCGAINSAALLLKSANDQHPHGLANSSGVVGRHYMAHNNSTLLALSRTPNSTVFQKTIAINDFYFATKEWDYPMGHISMVGKTDTEILRSGAPKFAPGMALDVMAQHSIDFWLTSEDLPDPENRVEVTSDGRIKVSYTPNNLEGHDRLIGKLKSLLHECGMEDKLMHNDLYMGKKIPIAGVAHQCGTVRFGSDAQTSALDVNCKAHDLDNLYVVDGSFFPSSSAVNPGLTIMANALRIGDHLLARMS